MRDRPIYSTKLGKYYLGDTFQLLDQVEDESINLIITSPPFGLTTKKEYGNKVEHEYIKWFVQIAKKAYDKLKEDGSFVIDIGGAYKRGIPSRSLYNYKLLIQLCEELNFHLAQDLFWFNPAKLPSPAEWVTVRKIRIKDSVNPVWWLSKTPFPKTNIERILKPQSKRMKELLDDPDKFYRPKKRPSGHKISEGFKNQEKGSGSIPPNLFVMANTDSNSIYMRRTRNNSKSKRHPARFPKRLPEFFIDMLTDQGDVVMDLFAGSNTTGIVAETMKRKWISFEKEIGYIASSIFWFIDKEYNVEADEIHDEILNKNLDIDISELIDSKN